MGEKKIAVAYIHTHTKYSYKDAIGDIKEYALKIEELNENSKKYNIKGMAISEHGNCYSMVSSRVGLENKGITHLLGVESYVLDNIEEDKKNGKKRYHMVMICKNDCYKKFIAMVSKAGHQKYKSSVKEYQLLSEDDFKEYGKYLVCTTACIGGKVPQLILEGRYKEAKRIAIEYSKYTDLYLEVQPHDTQDQRTVNEALVRMSEETGIPLVMGTDTHYANKSDHALSKAFKKIAFGKASSDDEAEDNTYYSHLRSFEELEEYCIDNDIPLEALSNTYEIYKECNKVNFKPKDPLENMPVFPVPKGMSVHDYLCKVAYKALNEKIKEHKFKDVKVRFKRLAHELMVIEKSGFSGYFLILHDWVKAMRERDVLIGPGRGCFTPNNKVLMADGSFKNINDVLIGDYIINAKGEKDLVTNTFAYPVEEDVISIETYGGKKITCTLDHKILTSSGYKKANSITGKDRLLMPNHENDYSFSSLSEKEGEALGIFVANSYSDDLFEIIMPEKEEKLINHTRELFKDVFEDELKVYELFRSGKKGVRLISQKSTREKLSKLLKDFETMHNKDFETGFIKGFFMIAKHIEDPKKAFVLCNREECHDKIVSLLYRHKILVSYKTTDNRVRYHLNRDSLSVLYNEYLERDIGDFNERMSTKKIFKTDKGYEVRVKKIARRPFKGTVYDLCVQSDHSYNIDMVGVHNSSAGLN